MNANELRIGNYINKYFEGELMSKISVVSRDIFEVVRSENESDFKFTFKPIPITKEWLIKFGFKYNEEDQAFTNNMLHIEDRDNDRYIPEKTRQKLKGYFGVWFDDSPSFITDIKHVHQLQNLYFALTGEEL